MSTKQKKIIIDFNFFTKNQKISLLFSDVDKH